jgi:hypothetical protein
MGKARKAAPGPTYSTGFATDEGGSILDGATGMPLPPTPRKRRHHVRLASIQDVQDELARLYRAARAGELDTADASRLGFLLVSLGKIMKDSDLEARITELEQSQQFGR